MTIFEEDHDKTKKIMNSEEEKKKYFEKIKRIAKQRQEEVEELERWWNNGVD